MRALSELVDMDISVLTLRPVEETVEMRLRDESSWVRQVTLDLLGRILEGSLSTEANSGEVTPRLLSMESATPRWDEIPLRAEEDGILDGTFKDREVASTLIGASPLPGVEKEAHEAYQEGLNAQTSGDLATAVRSYAQALRLESDPYDRSYILYNLGLCFAENGEYTKAAKYYMMAIDQNYELCSAWNNLGVIFHVQGMKAEQDYRSERAEALFAKAAQRVNDTAVIVRRQATKILSAFVLNHPDHPDVIPVTLDLLRRSTDSDALRNLVMGTFELLWFMDDEPTPEAAKQLSRVVDASRAMSTLGDILNELLRRFRKTIGSRKNSKGYEFAIRRWTTLILNEFVQLRRFAHKSGKPAPVKKVKLKGGGMKQEPAPAESPEETNGAKPNRRASSPKDWTPGSVMKGDGRLGLLGDRGRLQGGLVEKAWNEEANIKYHTHNMRLGSVARGGFSGPSDPFCWGMSRTGSLQDTSTPEEQWVAIKVCRILSSVLPYVAERRGLMDHRQVQADLQALIRSQPSSGVHEAVRCLCLVVKYVTGDLPQIVTHLNVAVPSLSKLCSIAEQKPGSLDRIQIMYMSRQAWVLSSILETLSVDDYVDSGLSKEPKRRLLPRSELKFDFVGNSVAGTVADLLLRLNELGEPQLRADPRISELLSGALSSGDLLLCRRALETLSTLLGFFRNEAEKESKANAADFADSRDGQVLGHTDGKASKTNSAIEAAQPLAAFSDQVLAHITLAGSEDLEAQRAESVLRVRVEALAVARHLHQQGLVNPMTVLPKVFALAFASEWRLSEPATTMLKEMLELRPQLLLNRLEESFRESFIALLCGFLRLGEVLGTQQLAGLGEVYAERFRKQKLRWAGCGMTSDQEASQLAALGVIDDEEALRKESVAAAQQLPLRQRQQLLYSQFIAGAISSLPFNFESEPLLLIYDAWRKASQRN
eukprot:g33230.t1